MTGTQPNLVYLKAAWAAFAGISGANCQQSYEQAGLTFERINHSSVVRKNKTQVSTMPLRYTRHDLRVGFLGRIEMEARKAAAEIEAILDRDLVVPGDHKMVVTLEESMRFLRSKGNRAVSFFVGPTLRTDDPVQIHVEIRLFLDAPRACLFARRGQPGSLGDVDLLAEASKRERHPRATTYAELAQLMTATLNAVIGSAS